MSEGTEFITIIRPSFMRFCKDACRAAAFNHILFRIAGKCKDQTKGIIQSGEITWYAKTEQIREEMSEAWGVCKIRQEVNGLIAMGIVGRSNNPNWGADRTKHFAFGTKQCIRFLDLCEEHNICVVHLGLSPEVIHLIYSSNANDRSIKCTCQMGSNSPEQMIDLSNGLMNSSDANDRSIGAITIDVPTIDNYKERDTYVVIADANNISSQPDLSEKLMKPVIIVPQEQTVPSEPKQEKKELPPKGTTIKPATENKPRKIPGVSEEESQIRIKVHEWIDTHRGYKLYGRGTTKQVIDENKACIGLASLLYRGIYKNDPDGCSWEDLDEEWKHLAKYDKYWSQPNNRERIGAQALLQMFAQTMPKLRKNGKPVQGTLGQTSIMTHDEAVQLASDMVAQMKQHGDDNVQAYAELTGDYWIVRATRGKERIVLRSQLEWVNVFDEIRESEQQRETRKLVRKQKEAQ